MSLHKKTYTVTTFTGLALFAMFFPTIGLPVLGASVAISGALVADDIIFHNRLRKQEWLREQQQRQRQPPLLITQEPPPLPPPPKQKVV